MAKEKTVWFCSQCGAESPKWEGKCRACGAWNSMVEEKVSKKQSKGVAPLSRNSSSRPQRLTEIEPLNEPRIPMPSAELNRVLGG